LERAADYGMSIVGSLFCVFLTPTLVSRVFKIPPALEHEALYSFYTLSFSLLIFTLTAAFRGVLEAYQRFDFANLLQILTGISTFVGPLLVSYFTSDLFFLVQVLVGIRILLFFAHLWFVFRLYPDLRNPARIEKATLRRLFRFATWMTVTNIVSPIMVYFDRFLLGAIVPVAQIAFYTTPYEIVNRLLVMPAAVVRTLFPTFSSLGVARSTGVEMIFMRCVKWLGFVLFPTVLIIVYFGEEGLRWWLGTEFALESTSVLRVLSIGILLNGIALLPMTLLQSAERPDLSAKIHLFELPIYLGGVWFMATNYGIRGAAIAWSTRVSIDMFLLFGAVRWILPTMGRELLRMVLPFLVFMVFFIPAFLNISLGTKVVLIVTALATFFFLFWSVILRIEDRIMVFRQFRRGKLPTTSSHLPIRQNGKSGIWAIVAAAPNAITLAANVRSYLGQVEGVIVVDFGLARETRTEIEGIEGVEILSFDDPVPTVTRLNRAILHAHGLGAEWIGLFDEGSTVDSDYFQRLLAVAEGNAIALIAPSAASKGRKRERLATNSESSWTELKNRFSVGSLIRMSALERTGIFEEHLSPDESAHELTLRLLSHGFTLASSQNVVHESSAKADSGANVAIVVDHYLQTKNRVFIYRRFFWFDPIWILRDAKDFFGLVSRSFLFRGRRIRQFSDVVRGGLSGLMAPLDEQTPTLEVEGADGRIGIVLAAFEPNLEFLRLQLESIQEQTDRNWFCVINDDNSKHATFLEIEKTAAEVFAEPQGRKWRIRSNAGRPGVVGNFADGVKTLNADCKLICFSDQDDVWNPQKLALMRHEFLRPHTALVHSDLRLVDANGREIHPSCWLHEGRSVDQTTAASLILRNSISGCAAMFRREVLDFCLPFPDLSRMQPWFYHDVWVALGASVFGQIRALPIALIDYRQHGGNVVGAVSAASRPKRGSSEHSLLQKLETMWRSRAVLEDEYGRRLASWAANHGGEAPRVPHVFNVSWDFGLTIVIYGARNVLSRPSTMKVTLAIAAGKFVADIGRLASRLGLRSIDAEPRQVP
jgi:O-antigen/teichoic acid export membrane protein/glycosyltransferase involved in cell wall biosynthesis